MNEGLSERKACQQVGISRRGLGLTPTPHKDAELREKLRSVWRPNMGYRMAHATVKAEFALLNVKRVHRLWKEEKLGRMKRCRKKRTGKADPLAADRPNHVWCLDFVFDRCLNGTNLKILAVKDEFTKECLALEVGTSFRTLKVQSVLADCIARYGAPAFLRSDNGSEFVSRSLAVFLSQSGTKTHFIKPGSPWQNGFIESFNSRLRADCLDVEVFYNLADAQLKLTVYRQFYNEERPHSRVGYIPPASFRAQFLASVRATPSLQPETAPISSTSL
jgi:transposase InsO family protein